MPHKCKERRKEYARKRYEEIMHSPDYKKYSQEYYQSNKEKIVNRSRDRHLRISYNMDRAKYQHMVEAQENKCAICGNMENRVMKNGQIKPLSIDHDHTTGKVRKLLCNDCNAAIGFAKEDPMVLQKMIDYLNNFLQPNREG